MARRERDTAAARRDLSIASVAVWQLCSQVAAMLGAEDYPPLEAVLDADREPLRKVSLKEEAAAAIAKAERIVALDRLENPS